MVVLLKALNRYNANTIKISMIFFHRTIKTIKKSIWRHKKIAYTTINRKINAGDVKTPNLKLYCRATRRENHMIEVKTDMQTDRM